MKNKEIRSSWNCTSRNHRELIDICPECEAEFSYDKWTKAGIILITDVVAHKSDYLAVVAECPKCFFKSWIHEELPIYNCTYQPKNWIKKSGEILEKRQLHALREWKNSICGECEHLKSGEITTHVWITCKPSGYNRTGNSKQECKDFKNCLK